MFSNRLLTPCLLGLSLLMGSNAYAASKATVTQTSIHPFSIVRLHDRVSYMVSVSYRDGKKVQRWQAADCREKRGKQLYWDLLNDKGLTTSRYYGQSYLRYAPAQEESNISQADLLKVCDLAKASPVWEKVSPTNAEGMTNLIDVASFHYIGKVLSVRLGYDFADIIWEPPYDAPLGLKIEHYLYNCESHQGAVVAALNINPEGYVTDSLIADDLIRRKKDFPANAEMTTRFEQICQLPAGKKYKALGKFTSATHKKPSPYRGPQMPDLSNNDPEWLQKYALSDELNHSVQALIKPWALPLFKQIRYKQISESDSITVQLDAQPDGYIRKLEEYSIWNVQRVTAANIFQLKFAMSIGTKPFITKDLKTDLHFPLVAGQHFQASWHNEEFMAKTGTLAHLRCEVKNGDQARNIAPVFSGRYLVVECDQTQQGQPPSHSKDAWLQDYHVLVPLTEQLGDKPEHPVNLVNVSLVK